jgi:hypothetical protein
VQQEKMLRAEGSWTNPLNALQEAIITPLQNSAFTVFPSGMNFMHSSLRVEKNYEHDLDAGPLEFQFLWQRGCLTNPPFRTLSLCFGVIGKTPGLISRNNFVKKIFVCISYCDNILARCDLIFPLLRCQGVWNRTCTQLLLSQILFQDPKNIGSKILVSFFMRSVVIFDQISNCSTVYLSSSLIWTATSLVIFYQLPSVSKSRIPPRKV